MDSKAKIKNMNRRTSHEKRLVLFHKRGIPDAGFCTQNTENKIQLMELDDAKEKMKRINPEKIRKLV